MANRSLSAGPRVFPILDVFERLHQKPTKGYQLIKPGPNGEPPEIQTFLIGRRRYATEEALQAYIQAQIAKAQKESAAERAAKVQKAVAGRAAQRQQERAEKSAA